MTVEATYDRYANVYDVLFGAVLEPGRRRLARLLASEPAGRLLEMGVGSGLMLPLYPAHFSIVGVDVSDSMLEHARRRASALAGRAIELRHVDGEHSGLGSESFDQVVLPYIYSVTPAPEQLMQECFRICRPSGVIWILNHFSGLEPVWDLVGRLVKPFADSIGFRSDFPFDQHVTSKGWQIEQVERVNLLGLSRIVKLRKPAST